MTATNHVLTGAVIGSLVKNPALALPLALLSHFVLDVLPHFGGDEVTFRIFKQVLLIDTLAALVALIFISWPGTGDALRMSVCGIVAASPDLAWIPYFVADLRGKPKPHGPYSRFAKKIQWCERPWGMAVEIVWAGLMIFALIKLP